MKIGLVVNDFHTEAPGYTTTQLAMAATNLGHEVWYLSVGDFAYAPDERVLAHARMVPRSRYTAAHVYLDELKGAKAVTQRLNFDELDVLMLRNDPAEDVNKRPWARLAGISFGRLAIRYGVIVLNDPDGLMRATDKMYLQYFPQEVRPYTLISRDREEILQFIEDQGGSAVLKPLTGSKGRNVFLITPEEANINQIIDTVCADGYVIAQERLSEAVKGDVRLFLMNGQPLCCEGKYAAIHRARKQSDGDIRSNMAVGAVAQKAHINDRMLRLAELIRPKLVRDGMFLVGIDIVGDKLVEINVFSPGGLISASKFESINFGREIISALERKVDQVRQYPQRLGNDEIACL